MVTLGGYCVSRPSSGVLCAVPVGRAQGSLQSGATYRYRVTFVTSFGETDGNETPTVFVAGPSGVASITGIPTSPCDSVIARKIYRTVAGRAQDAFRLAAVVDGNLQTACVDTLHDGSLGAPIPRVNTAHSRSILGGLVQTQLPLCASCGVLREPCTLPYEINIIDYVSSEPFSLPPAAAQSLGARVVVINSTDEPLTCPLDEPPIEPGLATQYLVAPRGRWMRLRWC